MHRWLFRSINLVVLLTLSCLLPLTAAQAAVLCTSTIDTSKDVIWRPVKDDIKKLHFLAATSSDRPNCPGGEGCELPAFLLGGDQVLVTTEAYEPIHKKKLTCGVYISPKGIQTFGWLDTDGFNGGGNVMEAIDDPKVFGDWTNLGGADISITPGQAGTHINIEGSAVAGPAGNERTGEIAGPAFIGGGGDVAGYSDLHFDGSTNAATYTPIDDDGCRVRFRFTGYYLLVDDNSRCGGQGVYFDGIYVKKAAAKAR